MDYVENTIKITVSLPTSPLSPNSRCHWAVKAKATKRARIEAWAMAQVAMYESNVSGEWVAAACQCLWFARDNRRRDRDNCLSSLKATFDGLADARLLVNDAGLVHLPLRIFTDPKNPRIELILNQIELQENNYQ